MIHLLVTPKSYEVRKEASKCCKILIENLFEVDLSIELISSFKNIFERYNEQGHLDDIKETNESQTCLNKTALVKCLQNICYWTANLSQNHSHQIHINSFLSTHLPVVYSFNSKVWINFLRRILKGDQVENFLTLKAQEIFNLIKNETLNRQLQFNCIKTLVHYLPNHFIDLIVNEMALLLSKSEFQLVTKIEYEIFNHPENEIYDKSVLEAHKEDNNIKNIKRESKLYSYKEQIEEIELRKELEKKKSKKNVEATLNKKQLEAKKNQLIKEASIREKVKLLENEFEIAMNYFYALMEGNAYNFTFYISKVVVLLTNLLSSPLCASRACTAFIKLSKCAFYANSNLGILSKTIAFATLRLLKPNCSLDPAWQAEDLNRVIHRLIDTLYQRTCPPSGLDYDEKSVQLALENRLTAPAFAFFFPLLSLVLLSNKYTDDLLEQCLRLIIEHSQLRFEPEKVNENQDFNFDTILLKNPEYLPRKDILKTLFEFMSHPVPHLELLTQKAIQEVALCANGLVGCTRASNQEIDILLKSLRSENENIREVALDCLLILVKILKTIDIPSVVDDLTKRIWIARFDQNDNCNLKAHKLWDLCGISTNSDISLSLIDDLLDAGPALRASIAGAIESILKQPDQIETTVIRLIELYKKHLKAKLPKFDAFGRPITDLQIDNFQPRLGVALVLAKIAPLLFESLVIDLAKFLVPLALKDYNESVQNQMLEAGINIVDIHGNKCMTKLLSILETYLDEAPDNSENDIVRRSVVILMGTLAKHLDKDDPKVKPIVVKLIETLSTPSQMVQEAVANCLPALIPAFKDEAPLLVKKLLHLLLESDKYGERKGAAHGIAGIVKGLGILSLKQLNIMDTLTEAIQDKKNPNRREGSLFAFEMLCNMLGRLFEPYIIHILPNLLLCLGDSSPKVRQATDDTAKAFMVKLSAHGVKLVLPSLLDALEEDSWRTKAGSIDLLGAMAYCAPKQLSSCLPSIVPKLMIVLSDSHTKVQKAGAQALKQIGSVIINQEIQAIVPILLEALQDPANKTHKCLVAMLNTKFVHFIDAPSLALIMPVIERAFQGRSTETRKMAAQIIGNMYSLTDQKDLSPYLSSIIPGLKQSLLDPVPEVRAVTARALGAMVKGMGEKSFEDLMPWLMSTLTSEASSVDRSGAAQGFSEVLGGLGLEKLEKLMPEIIATAERFDIPPHVKDGYIMLFIYLPMVFAQDFIPYIGRIINPVLKALADENEFVRETALKAGQRVVNTYADTAIQLFLPELEQGLFDDNWRIRFSSVQLLGDLLYKISGVSGKMSTETADEDDNLGTEHSYKAIITSLGLERRNRVLSGLYMGRCDVSFQVRQAALHVWKIVVLNTPRTLKEILPTLFSLLLGCLASNSHDKQKIAARTLGDLVKKLGERVLPEIIPILERGLESDRADQRQGVCVGLSEIMAATHREMVQAFLDSLVPTVTKALYDPLPEVRQAAAKTFDSLHSAVGSQALEEILPQLLKQLGDKNVGEYTLDGLRQVMAIKSRVVLPYLVPHLTVPPVNTRALSLLSSVADDSLNKHLAKILPALLQSLSKSLDTENEKQELEYCQSVILSVTDEAGRRTIVDHLLESARDDSVIVRRAAALLLHSFCCQNKTSCAPLVPQLIRGLILLFIDSNEQVLHLSWEALNSLTKNLDTKEQIEYVNEVRNAVRHAASDLKSVGTNQTLLPGFCIEKGIAPILPIFREAILNGNAEQKEQAADGLSEVIQMTSPTALKSSIVNMTGALIRILGDRYIWNVKVAVLDTLSLLLSKAGMCLRPFIPQLQQTFLKALIDQNRIVRLRAANAISYLILVHTRCELIFTEIHNYVKTYNNNDEMPFRETMLYALRLGTKVAGDKLSDTTRGSILSTVSSLVSSSDDSIRTASAACLGTLAKFLKNEELNNIAKSHLLEDDMTLDWTFRHGKSIALRIALKEAPERLIIQDWVEKVVKMLTTYMTSDRISIINNGIKGSAYFFKFQISLNEAIPQPLVYNYSRVS